VAYLRVPHHYEGFLGERKMATGRAYWKGYLKLSLVTCPVALYPASSQADKTHFHQMSSR
jgi:hypothetical protein